VVGFAVLLALLGYLHFFAGSSHDESDYRVHLDQVTQIGPNTARFEATVRNVGYGPGVPKCQVFLNNPQSGEHGLQMFSLRSLQVGRSMTFERDMAVSGPVGSMVTTGDATCLPQGTKVP
jgi:hypothetical protein